MKEDSNPAQVPAEGSSSGDRVGSVGDEVAALVDVFGVSEASIDNWLKQARIHRGEIEGLCLGRSDGSGWPVEIADMHTVSLREEPCARLRFVNKLVSFQPPTGSPPQSATSTASKRELGSLPVK